MAIYPISDSFQKQEVQKSVMLSAGWVTVFAGMRRWILCSIALWILSAYVWAEEKEAPIAIICPDMQEPYRTVFSEMVEGINGQLQVTVPLYMVGAKTEISDIQQKLKQSGAKVIITLGRQGLKIISGFSTDLPVVLGGVLSIPEGNEGRTLFGLSLTPDPLPMFTRMKHLMPDIKKVIVVYNPKHTGWLMKFAQEAAKMNGMELEALSVNSIESAAQQYNRLVGTIDRTKMALWLPQDSTSVDESVILPFVLKESWERGIPLFSSSVSHVQRGALFAMYPDNRKFGAALGELALHVARGAHISTPFKPFRNVQSTLNARIATHLGITTLSLYQKQFDTVLSPER